MPICWRQVLPLMKFARLLLIIRLSAQRARRQIDDQIIQFTPNDIPPELFDGSTN